MPPDDKLAALTRSLVLGVSLGAVGLTVGCAPAESPGGSEQRTHQVVQSLSGEEQRLCAEAFRTQSSGAVNRLLRRYPASRCIAPLLGSLPPSVLSALSSSAVAGIAPGVYNSLPRRVRDQLPSQGRSAGAGSRSGSY